MPELPLPVPCHFLVHAFEGVGVQELVEHSDELAKWHFIEAEIIFPFEDKMIARNVISQIMLVLYSSAILCRCDILQVVEVVVRDDAV